MNMDLPSNIKKTNFPSAENYLPELFEIAMRLSDNNQDCGLIISASRQRILQLDQRTYRSQKIEIQAIIYKRIVVRTAINFYKTALIQEQKWTKNDATINNNQYITASNIETIQKNMPITCRFLKGLYDVRENIGLHLSELFIIPDNLKQTYKNLEDYVIASYKDVHSSLPT